MDEYSAIRWSLWTLVYISVVCAEEVCEIDDGEKKTCPYNCCYDDDDDDDDRDYYCCMSGYIIGGIIFGVFVCMASIAVMVYFCLRLKKKKQRVYHGTINSQLPAYQHPVSTVQGSTHPFQYNSTDPSTQPLPPAYSSLYNNNNSSNNNFKTSGAPPPYSTQPPPAYVYSDPNSNPFASAAYNSTATGSSEESKA